MIESAFDSTFGGYENFNALRTIFSVEQAQKEPFLEKKALEASGTNIPKYSY